VLAVIPKLAGSRPLSLLCLGAHGDDIEIGCGGTLLRLLVEHPGSMVHWIVFSASGMRATEALTSANRFLDAAGQTDVVIEEFRDGFFPYLGASIKESFEKLKARIAPDLILTHYREDLHQDHRLVSQLTWNTFRDHLILEYEIPKYDGDIGTPNFFVHLDSASCRRKVSQILECFPSQRARDWFSEDAFYALLRLRGLECNAPQKYAEGFYCRKLVY
jgi:LmbE family N-acetylglucosaminyl deacetylase